MGKRKTRLIINPREGRNIAKLTNILAVLAAGGCETTVALKEYAAHTQELARQAVGEGAELVIAYGGDGTLNQVVNGVLNAGSQAVVGVIPGGTANLWATEIGIPTDDPVKAALALLDSQARSIDVGHVTLEKLTASDNDSPVKQKHWPNRRKKRPARTHFLLMAGLGLDATVMQGVSKPLKHKIKQLAVGLSAARELPAYRPFPFEIRDAQHDLLWQGEAIQVIVGNTRLYADVLHMTPDAHIDDGQLDVCIIISGDFLGTVQQIFSLLLRRQPDDLTAEHLRGPRFYMRMPAQVALQLDGSAIKSKDRLSKEQRQALKAADDPEALMAEYCFEAMPQSLRIAVPRAYDNALFEEEPRAETEPATVNESEAEASKQPAAASGAENSSRLLSRLREEGRKVNVVAAGFDAQHGSSIVAGTYPQAVTGVAKPVALRVDHRTVVLNAEGKQLMSEAVQKLGSGDEIIVSGKKSKRGVIQAEFVIV